MSFYSPQFHKIEKVSLVFENYYQFFLNYV